MLQHAATVEAKLGERTGMVRRIEQLCAKLREEGAWTALVQAERLLAEVHGVVVRGGRAPCRATANDASDRLIVLLETLTTAWADGRCSPPTTERLRALRAALARTTALLEATTAYDAE